MSTFEAGRADLQLTAHTSGADESILALRETFHSSVNTMSDDSLRLASATERLDRALIKSHGKMTSSVSAAELRLREVNAKIRASSEETAAVVEESSLATGGGGYGRGRGRGGRLRQEERSASRFGRGALGASGLAGRALAFGSTAFLGGAGVAFAIRAATKAAEDHQVVEKQLGASLHAQGISWAEYRDEIDKTLRSQEQLTGFTEEDTTRSFIRLVRTTGDVGKALRYNAEAADIARGANISLDSASKIVVKALAGQTTGLRRLGVDLPKGVTGYQALEIAQRKYAGSSEAFSRTAAGAQARLAIAVHQTEITIGNALLPTLTRLSGRLANWLGQSRNQERIQRDVTKGVHVAGQAIHGLEDAFHKIEPPVRLVNRALGGTKHTVELLVLAFAALKVKGLLTELGLIRGGIVGVGRAAVVSAGEVGALAEAETAAGGGGAAGAAGGARGLLSRGKGLLFGGAAAVGAGVPQAIPGAKGFGGYTLSKGGGIAKTGSGGLLRGLAEYGFAAVAGQGYGHNQKLGGPLDVVIHWAPGGSGGIIEYTDPVDGKHRYLNFSGKLTANQLEALLRADLLKREPQLSQAQVSSTAPQRGLDSPRRQFAPPPDPPGKPRPKAKPLDRLTRIQDDISAAELAVARGERGAEARLLKALQEEVAYDRHYEQVQESLIRRGIGDRKQHAAILQRLQADEASALGQIGGIQDQRARTREQAHKKEQQAHKKELEAERRRRAEREKHLRDLIAGRERALQIGLQEAKLTDTKVDDRKALERLIAFDRKEEHDRRLSEAERQRYRQKELAERLALKNLDKKKAAASAAADERQFLSSFQQIVGSYAPNATPAPDRGGKTDTHLYELVHETRRSNAHLRNLVGRTSFPASGYAAASAAAVGS